MGIVIRSAALGSENSRSEIFYLSQLPIGHGARAIKPKASSTTAAAAKDSMVRCKHIDERIKQFVKQANENADPKAQEAAGAELAKMGRSGQGGQKWSRGVQ
eukprot:COSAG06_NODE_6997_length_2683_cov_4.586300_4_plen_102_part_00